MQNTLSVSNGSLGHFLLTLFSSFEVDHAKFSTKVKGQGEYTRKLYPVLYFLLWVSFNLVSSSSTLLSVGYLLIYSSFLSFPLRLSYSPSSFLYSHSTCSSFSANCIGSGQRLSRHVVNPFMTLT